MIRLARPADVATVHTLLSELAAFEGGAVQASMDDLARDGFGPRPLFEVLLAERAGEALGMLVFFPIYSSWRGRAGVMIHDLFVREAARGRGVGKALVAELVRLNAERGGARLDVNVLDWNARARAFYESLGFRHNQGWLGYRLER
jgi:Sortase and related acyltransferases